MYEATIYNGSPYTWTTGVGSPIAPGDSWSENNLGSVWFTCTECGTLNLLDIGDVHIGGDSKETWGVLFTYQGEEMVGRYEGGGKVRIDINQFGQATLQGMDLRQVALSGLQIAQPSAA
jgi:hypothetical protein